MECSAVSPIVCFFVVVFVVFFVFHSFKKKAENLQACHGVFTKVSPDIYSWLNSFPALMLWRERGAYCCSLTQSTSDRTEDPSSKGPLGGHWFFLPHPDNAGQSQIQRLYGRRLPPSVRQARLVWVDASCIIDKVCLGRAPMGVCSWSAPLRAPSSSQAAGLKRDMPFVLFVSQHKTQPGSAIHLSFEARDWSV